MADRKMVEIEFPTTGRPFELVMDAMRRLDGQVGQDAFHVESLVRVHGELMGLWAPYTDEPCGYAYRIHLRSLPERAWLHVQRAVLHPLTRCGISVRVTA